MISTADRVDSSPCEEAQAAREAARDAIHSDLLRQTGPLVGGEALRRVLGFTTPTAFRRALERGQIPVYTFSVSHRRGRFALARDIADWLSREAYPRAATPTDPVNR